MTSNPPPVPVFDLKQGSTAVLISVPHAGTYLPPELADTMTTEAHTVPDTDWFIDALYNFALELGAGMIVANFSRFVIDLNRPPDGGSLYPGQATTGLCPITLFDGTPIYLPEREPDEAEVERRRAAYWQPYHDGLQAELTRIRDEHGHAVLYDAHSIASTVPRLFDGKLPDLNLGTANGASADAGLTGQISQIMDQAPFTSVVNGRFVGGHITRTYGRPHENIHGLQMEIGLDAYMGENSASAGFDIAAAAPLQKTLRSIVETMINWRQQ